MEFILYIPKFATVFATRLVPTMLVSIYFRSREITSKLALPFTILVVSQQTEQSLLDSEVRVLHFLCSRFLQSLQSSYRLPSRFSWASWFTRPSSRDWHVKASSEQHGFAYFPSKTSSLLPPASTGLYLVQSLFLFVPRHELPHYKIFGSNLVTVFNQS